MPKFLYLYGVVSVYVGRFPNGLVERVQVSHVQFVPRHKYPVSIETFSNKIKTDNPGLIDPEEYQEFLDEMITVVKQTTDIYAHFVLIYNENAYMLVDEHHAAFLADFIGEHKIKQRALSADGTYYEYCKTVAFHASMDKKITSYEHCGIINRLRASYLMIANYLNKNAPRPKEEVAH